MNKCISCNKTISLGAKTLSCITCFNKSRIGSNNPMWKGGITKKPNPLSRFLGPLSERFGEKNPMFGRKLSEETKERMRQSKIGKKNPMWRGDKVKYYQLHTWVKYRLPKPKLCELCNNVPPYDLANKGIYDRDLENWEWLCRSCHMKKDGRSKNGYKKIDKNLIGK